MKDVDADIIELARRGDPAAWEQIVTCYTRRVYNLCYRFLGRLDQAEDLTQEIFLKVFRNLESYKAGIGPVSRLDDERRAELADRSLPSD